MWRCVLEYQGSPGVVTSSWVPCQQHRWAYCRPLGGYLCIRYSCPGYNLLPGKVETAGHPEIDEPWTERTLVSRVIWTKLKENCFFHDLEVWVGLLSCVKSPQNRYPHFRLPCENVQCFCKKSLGLNGTSVLCICLGLPSWIPQLFKDRKGWAITHGGCGQEFAQSSGPWPGPRKNTCTVTSLCLCGGCSWLASW